MRVLVTGVSGFIGGHIARHLAGVGFTVIGTYRHASPAIEELEAAGITMAPLNLVDSGFLWGPFDAVVHAAAAGPWCTEAEIDRDNITAMRALVKAAVGWGAKAFVFCSSVSIYGRIEAPVVDENTPIIDPDKYGRSKRYGESFLAVSGMPSLALRLPGVIGAGAHARNWLPRVVASLKAGEAVRAFNLAMPFNNAVHVADLARFVETVLRRNWSGFDAVVLAALGAVTVREAIERLARGLDVEARIEESAAVKMPFFLSPDRAVQRWGYDPMFIRPMIDRYASECR